jgi:hypothetical protein
MVAVSSSTENVMTVSRSGAVRDKLVPFSSGCEHAFGFTSKGSITGQLQRALAKRDVLAVRSLAGELPSVPLPLAAEITSCSWSATLRATRPQRDGSSLDLQLSDRSRFVSLRMSAFLAELEASPAPMAASKTLVSLVESAPD